MEVCLIRVCGAGLSKGRASQIEAGQGWGGRGRFLKRSKCLPRPALWSLRVLQALQNPPLMGPTAKLGKIRGFPSRINRCPVGRGDHGRKELKVGLGNGFTTRAARYLYSVCDLREGGHSLVPWVSQDTWFWVRSGAKEGQTFRARGSSVISLSYKCLSP